MTVFRELRQGSPLLLQDLRVLLGKKAWAIFSRVEADKQSPSREMLLLYHIIFDIPIENLIVGEKIRMKRKLKRNVKPHIEALKSRNEPIILAERIKALETIYDTN